MKKDSQKQPSLTIVVAQNMNKPIAIIGIHGWQGDTTSLQPLTKSIKGEHIHWFLPQGPYRASEQGYSWYGGTKETGWKFDKSFEFMDTLVEQVLDRFPPHHIYFLGFSQGAVFAFHYIVKQLKSFGGAIPISGFVPHKRDFESVGFKKKNDTPFLILHGKDDTVVKPSGSEDMHSILTDGGFSSELYFYDGGHKIRLSAIDMIKSFLFRKG